MNWGGPRLLLHSVRWNSGTLTRTYHVCLYVFVLYIVRSVYLQIDNNTYCIVKDHAWLHHDNKKAGSRTCCIGIYGDCLTIAPISIADND